MNYETPRDKLRKARTYDCGSAGQLTAQQAALRAGVEPHAIRSRYRDGVRGDDLLTPPQSATQGEARNLPLPHGVRRQRENLRHRVRELARDFAGRHPNVAQLRARFDCSRATAYRIQRAWRDVFGEPKREA